MASALIGAYIIIFDATSLCYTSLYVLHIAIYVLIHIMLLGRFGLIYIYIIPVIFEHMLAGMV